MFYPSQQQGLVPLSQLQDQERADSASPSRNAFTNLFKLEMCANRHCSPSEVMKEAAEIWNNMSPQEKMILKNEASRSPTSQSRQVRYALEEHLLGATGRRQLNSFKAAVDVYMAKMIANHINRST